MDADIAVLAATKGSGIELVYATLVDYDPVTELSTISILDGDIEGVAKLAHVSLLETNERLVATGNATSSTRLSIPIPAGCEAGIRVELTGRTTGALETILLRVNNDSTSNLYRRVRSGLDSGVAGAAMTSTDAWAPGRASTSISSMDVRIIPAEGQSIHGANTQMYSIGHEANGNTTQVASGRLNDSRTITTLDFIATSNWNTNTTWRLYGTKHYDSPPQLLCIRSELVPLTIIGVLSGSTV